MTTKQCDCLQLERADLELHLACVLAKRETEVGREVAAAPAVALLVYVLHLLLYHFLTLYIYKAQVIPLTFSLISAKSFCSAIN